MSVYRKAGQKFYLYDFELGGRRFYGSTGATNKRAAREIETRERERASQEIATAKAAAAELKGDAPLTIDTAAGRYWIEVGQYHKGASDTWTAISAMIAHFGPSKRLAEITNADIASWVAKRRGEKVLNRAKAASKKALTPPKTVSPATVNRTTVDLLRKIETRARKVWQSPGVRERDWKHLRLAERGEMIVEIGADDEVRIIGCLPAGYRSFVAFAQASGLRRKECLLTWKQVDESTGVISVVQKGGRPHTIPVSSEIATILNECRGHHPEFVFTYIARRTKKPHLIRGERYPITISGLKSEWRRAAEKLGLTYRLHDLRHTRATRLLRASGNLKLAQRLLGHASIETTAKFYAHTMIDDLRAALDAEAPCATSDSLRKIG